MRLWGTGLGPRSGVKLNLAEKGRRTTSSASNFEAMEGSYRLPRRRMDAARAGAGAVDRGTSAHRFVIRRGAATSAVKAAAEFGRESLETEGNEIELECLSRPRGMPARSLAKIGRCQSFRISGNRDFRSNGPARSFSKYAPTAGMIKQGFTRSKVTSWRPARQQYWIVE